MPYLNIVASAIDWVSIKLTGLTVGLAMITANHALSLLAGVATLSTIVYNSIRIYKELKHK